MDIGFIGLGNMGFPIARRLVAANHRVVAHDARPDGLDRFVALVAQAASPAKDAARRNCDGQPGGCSVSRSRIS